jgi:hypothetical protein
MKKQLGISTRTNPSVTWDELTDRLAKHITNLHSASNSQARRAEIRRWNHELTSLETTCGSNSRRRERGHDC